jgi:hypothetical protein
VFSEFTDIGYDDMLGSTPIGWPEQWVASKIVTDSNHYDTVNTLSLYFGVYSSYNLLSGVVEAYLPTDLDNSLDCTIDNYGDVLTDYVVTCNVNGEFDEAGPYGPINLVVRESQNGQILAQDTAFGYFSLVDSQPDSEELLTVEYFSSSPDLTVSADATLTFSFALDEDEEIHRWDYFELILDSSFTVEEELEVTLNDTTNAVDFPEDGVIVHNSTVYFVGLGQDLSGNDNANFTFKISGFSNPNVKTTGDGYEWTLKIWRYGTPTLLKWITGTGPADDITTGTITVDSFEPLSSEIDTENMYSGLVTYMVMTLKPEHDIPAGGQVEVVITGGNVASKTYESGDLQDITAASGNNYGLVYDDVFSSGTAAGSTVTLTVGSGGITGGAQFTFTSLVEITDDALGVDSVETSFGNALIDELDEFTDLDLNGDAFTVNSVGVYTANNNDTGINTAGAAGSYGIGLNFTAPKALAAEGYTIKIHIPVLKLASPSTDASNIVISTDFNSSAANGTYVISSLTDADFLNIKSDTAIASGVITITEPDVIVANGEDLFIFIGSNDAADDLYLPGLITFLKDTPQIVVTLTLADDSVYVYSAPWYIRAGQDISTVDFQLLCSDVAEIGMPGKLTITPNYDLDFNGYSLLIEVVTNLDYADFSNNYTSIEFIGQDIDSAEINDDSDGFSFELDSLTEGDAFELNFPLPVVAGSVEVTVTISVVDSNNDTLSYVLSTETMQTVTVTDALTSNSSYANITANDDNDETIVFDLTYLGSTNHMYALIYGGDYIEIVDTSFIVGDYQIVIGDDDAKSFSFDIVNPWYDVANETVTFIVAAGTVYNSTGCSAYETYEYNYWTGESATFSDVSYEPTEEDGYTFENPEVEIKLTLEVDGAIYNGAEIVVELGSEWGTDGVWKVTLDGEELDGVVVSRTWTLAELDFESGENPTLVISVSGLTRPDVDADESVGTVYDGFVSVTVTYAEGDGPSWVFATVDSADVEDFKTTFTGIANDALAIDDEEAWIFPNLIGSELVYFGLTFSTDIDLASGDQIEISGVTFETDSDAELNTWCTIGFSSASITANNLVVTLNQALESGETITIIKDLAFTPTADDSEVTVTVVRGNDDIVTGTVEFETQAESATATIAIDTSNKNPGFSSVHTFTVTVDTALEAGSCILFDASADYNIALGEVYMFEDYGFDMFLWAEDGYFYEVKHWVLEYVTSQDYDAGSEIVFEVEVQNPQSSGSWKVYVTDVNMTFIASKSSDTISFDSVLDDTIDLYFVSADFSSDAQTHDLLLEAFVDVTTVANGNFYVMFPAPYDLDFDNSGTVPCSISYGDAEIALSTSSCPVSDNTVLFTVANAQEITSDSWVYFTVNDLVSPKWGFEIDAEVYEYEEFSAYTGRFCVGYGNAESDISDLSFDNVNGAYLGFEVVLLSTFSINNGETIVITPGTYSGVFTIVPKNYDDGVLSESTVLFTESVTLSAEIGFYDVEGDIELSDEATYSLDFYNPSAEFWIGAAADCPEGMYYIKWTVDESNYGSSEKVYASSLKTKLEVSKALTYEINIDFEGAFYVPPSGYSFPYMVSISSDVRTVSPYEEIKFTLTAGNESSPVVFYPSNEIVFEAFETFTYIYASCKDCSDGEIFDVEVEASENSGAFVFEDFSIEVGSPYEAEAEFSLYYDEDSLTPSGFEVLIDSDSWAVVTWCIVSFEIYNETIVQYEYLLDNTATLGSIDSEKWDIEDYIEDYNTKILLAFDDYDTYEEIAFEIIRLGKNIYFVGQQLIKDTTGQTLFDFSDLLVFESGYSIWAYVDNYWGGESKPNNYVDITTLSKFNPSRLSLSGDIDEDNIKLQLSQLLDMTQYQILIDSSSRRRLGEATVTLVSDVRDSKSPKSKVEAVGTETLTEKLGVGVQDLGEWTVPESIDWDEPIWNEEDDGIISINFTSPYDGHIYCVVEANLTLSGSYDSDNIRVGVDRDGDEAYVVYSNKTDSYESYEKVFDFTASGYGNYDIACVACDTYPLTPACTSVSNYTYEYAEDSSDSMALVFAAAAYFLI